MREEADKDVRRLMRAGQKIEAIKVYREATGVGLAEAKAYVEGRDWSAPAAPADDWEQPIRDLLARGQKIEAIRRFRELTGMGLKEAVDSVEALERGESAAQPDVKDIATDIEAELRQMIRDGETIAAIKRYREAAGVGLREAKEHIDDLERDMGRR